MGRFEADATFEVGALVTALALWPARARAADAPAVIDADGTRTWRELAARVARRAKELAVELALLHAPNDLSLVEELLALQVAGGVPVLVSPRVPRERAERWFEGVGGCLAARARAALAGGEAVAADALADVMFTSGSTGGPKAVAHSFGNQRASAEGANAHVPFEPGDRWLLSLSLCHVGGLGILERARAGGGAVVVPPPGMPLAEALSRFAITHVSLVRTQLFDLLSTSAGREALAQVKAVLVGGGPCPDALLADALAAGVPVAQTWGMTETTAQVTTSALGAPFTCGRPLPGRALRVDDEGRICVRGPTLAAGYVTEGGVGLPLDDEGWLVTSDLGRLDDEGNLMVMGRADNVFISGGENVQPEEIEAALLSHPRVREAVVVPVEHPRWGMRPVAFVDVEGGLSESELREHLLARLPRFLVPDSFWPWPDEERAGKPSRPRLTARARASQPR